MISEEYKCIFIHIARTGGSSVEKSIIGKNWWIIDPNTKHIRIDQAINIYGKEIWDEYFTFTIVRNPWDRVISMWKRWGIQNYSKDYSGADEFRNFIVTLKPHINERYNTLFYYKILNSELDFIGRFENLQKDYEYICQKLGLINRKLCHIEKSEHDHYSKYYTEETKNLVAMKFKKDIELFNYTFEEE